MLASEEGCEVIAILTPFVIYCVVLDRSSDVLSNPDFPVVCIIPILPKLSILFTVAPKII